MVTLMLCIGVQSGVALASTDPNTDPNTATSTSVVAVPEPVDEQQNTPLPDVTAPPPTVAAASTTVPVGCPPPPASQAVFVGRLDTIDATTGTFTVQQLRSGSLSGYSTDTTGTDGVVVTTAVVYYGRDVKFVDEGQIYLVGTALDVNTGRLYSRVSENTPLFGGNQVADINNSGVVCPTFDDPARTLNLDGSGIESGVLSSLKGSGGRIALSILVPAGLVLLALVTLVLVRRLLATARLTR
jgi:hypothetical protein